MMSHSVLQMPTIEAGILHFILNVVLFVSGLKDFDLVECCFGLGMHITINYVYSMYQL